MLLDRKKIRRWARWVSLFLAIAFGGGFLFMGVGYGGSGVSEIFKSNPAASQPQTPEDQIALLQAQLAENPDNVTALLGLATIYQQNGDLLRTAAYLEKALEVDPNQKDVYIRLATLYSSSNVANYSAAVTVLNKAVQVDPNNADVYLKLGTAQNMLGNITAALLAWQKYLELAPDGQMADVVRKQVDEMSMKPTTTTTGASSDATTATTPSP